MWKNEKHTFRVISIFSSDKIWVYNKVFIIKLLYLQTLSLEQTFKKYLIKQIKQ